jgi:hypothetical protein
VVRLVRPRGGASRVMTAPSAAPPTIVGMGSFTSYVDQLAELLRGDLREDQVTAALDGAVSRELRSRVTLDARRKQGAFFTGQRLATDVVTAAFVEGRPVVDPAVGAGDLLLAAANHLPLSGSVGATLDRWGRQLYGADLESAYVRATRIRLALLAAHRLGARTYLREDRLAELLPNIVVGDGQGFAIPKRSLVVLNPPYGSVTAPEGLGWAAGRVCRAAVFTAAVIERAPVGASLAAILPDVLRSGTNYRRWRELMQRHLHIEAVEPVGQFDTWADVDVFVLRGVVVKEGSAALESDPWSFEEADETVADLFEVNVGAVVPHRDPDEGQLVRYLTVHDLPLGDRIDTDTLALRRFGRRVFDTPFLAIRRTSRPGQQIHRAVGTIVTGAGPVAVENHLLVCTPKNGTIAACKELQAVLHSEATDAWLDDRIRCRHLTVGAVRDVPWQGRT